MKRRVVVTGLGAVTPIGNTVEEFGSVIIEGIVGYGEITKFDTTEYKVKIAAEVKDFQAKDRMDFKENEMNLELKEQDSEHNKKKKEEGSPKRKKGCFKRVLSVLVLVVIIGFSFLAGRQSVMT